MFDIKGLWAGGKQLAGLDIGSSCLKLAEVQETPKGRVVTRFSRMPLAKGVIVEGAVAEPEVLAETIKALFKASGSRRKKVVTSISGHGVIVKKVSFSQMDEEELRELIRDEAGKYLPFDDMGAVAYDFQILGENPYNPTQMEVLLVAAKKEAVDGLTEAVQAAGLEPLIVDVDTFALETMYEENYDFEPEDVVVLANVGASVTNLNVVKGGVSIFTRDFALGGNAVTEALADHLGIPFEEAEKAKLEGMGGDESAREAFRQSLLVHADPLCAEIERSVDYFRSTFGAENIKQILLSGGGVMIPGMAEELARRLGVETEIANPFKKVHGDKKALGPEGPEAIGPIAAVCVGLALRKLGDK